MFENIERILQDNYIPTDADISWCDVKTKSLSDNYFKIGDFSFLINDTGGAKAYRKSANKLFDKHINALVFVASISSFDQTIKEETGLNRTNRMQDSLQYFKDTVNHPNLKKVPFVLLLNKNDIFEQKLAYSPISKAFHGIKGSLN